MYWGWQGVQVPRGQKGIGSIRGYWGHLGGVEGVGVIRGCQSVWGILGGAGRECRYS